MIYILVAIILFAALSYTVSGMMRGGNSDMIGEERAKILGGEILDYGRVLRQAVQNLRISNGCSETDLSFENNILLQYTNTTNPPDRCKIFHPSGGDINYIVPNPEWLDAEHSAELYYNEWFITSVCAPSMPYAELGQRCEGSPFHDLVVLMPYIKQEICEQINALSSIEGIPQDAHKVGQRGYFTGSYGTDGAQHQHNAIIDAADLLVGKKSGCIQSTFPPAYSLGANTPYIYYQVLLER